VEVFPVNPTLEWKYEKADGIASFAFLLETSLVFADDTKLGRTDFTYIYNIERARDRCTRLQLFIDKRCDITDPFVPFWKGFFTMQDCSFQVEKCRVSVNVDVDDGTRCFLDQWDEPVNLVEGPADFTPAIKQTFGTIETEDCGIDGDDIIIAGMNAFPDLASASTVVNTNCITPGEGWTVLDHRGIFAGVDNGNEWAIITSWIRERYSSVGVPPDDNGNTWIEISPNEWARAPNLTLVLEYVVGYIDPLFPETWQFRVTYKQTALSGTDVQKLDNGR
jgi:hypothetical protein